MTSRQREIADWLQDHRLPLTVDAICAYYEATRGPVHGEAMRTGRVGVATRMWNALNAATPFFSALPVPADELARQQGITGPQGLEALGDPEWADDEHDRAFLAFILSDGRAAR